MKVSIIVPVYNSENYLARCVESVLRQTYDNWELLLINDGSTDASPGMCDAYAAQDARVRVFHQSNGGVSSARNLGLVQAEGDYITFLDSDDYLGEHFLQPFVAGEVTEDVIFTTAINVVAEGFEENEMPFLPGPVADETGVISFFNANLHLHQLRTPWSKFFRASILDGLSFDRSMRLGEDTKFCLEAYNRCKSLSVQPSSIYYYQVSERGKRNLKISESAMLLDKIMQTYYKTKFDSVSFRRIVFEVFSCFAAYEDLQRHPYAYCTNKVFKECARSVGTTTVKYWRSLHPVGYWLAKFKRTFLRDDRDV